MTARDEAIKAAAKAWFYGGPPGAQLDRSDIERLLDAAVPVLLNDLADRFERKKHYGAVGDAAFNAGINEALRGVRAAAEGWGQ